MDYVREKIAELDPKWVYGFVTFVLTYVVVQLLGLDPNQVVVTLGTVEVTYTVAIAFVAAEFVGWWKANAGTFLRRGELSEGNPDVNPEAAG